jgi:hypothetical protein
VELVNETKAAAGWTMGFDRDGRELVVVAVKATFTIPARGDEPELAGEQVPLVEADRFTGEPGFSAPLYEADYAHRRPMCDVLLNGSAYAPPATRATKLRVALQVGRMAKSFAVVGDRTWQRGVFGIRPGEPEPFEVMPITYDTAFGGVDRGKGDRQPRTFLHNPVGCGYSHYKEEIDGRSMPNTEELDKPVSDPGGVYAPMSFGSIGRSWQPRVQYAGTYDQKWLDNQAPFWPDDFDYRYFQSAPPDQQIPYPVGGEEVVLQNLTPDGEVRFTLPKWSMPVWLLPYREKDVRLEAAIDTLLLEPDEGIFTLVWRAVLPMRRSCFDIRQVIVGELSEAAQRVRKYGSKPYYKGLAELVRAQRRRR